MTGARTLSIVVVTALASACASGGGVPRPFPGAALPPGAEPPARAGVPAPEPPVTAADPGSTVPLPDTARAELVATALGLRGTPYRNGGSDPSGFDCSGFVQYVFARHATALPRETAAQFHAGVEVNLRDVQPGDLLFFETVASGASHVGVVVGGDQMVHAPSSRGVVRVESYTAPYWSRRFVGARRIVHASITRE